MSNLLYRCYEPAGKQHPSWSYNAVIYELNTRQFSPEGTFKAVGRQLKRLKGLGVDIIWMMPIFPIGQERRKGSLGSYYSIQDYRAVNPEFGTLNDFNDLVQEIHTLGMRIILDWVPNHTSRDAVWTIDHPDWYEHDSQTGEISTPFDWTDTAKLDYTNKEMRSEMVSSMKYWLTESKIDGYRIDMAMLVPTEFWNHVTPELEKVRPDIFMLAEAEGPEFHERAFDATYGWEMHHLINDIANQHANADTLRHKLNNQNLYYPSHAFQMQFTSNHDENSWNGSEFERLGDAARQMAMLSFILPGIPLIYNGQEVGSTKRLEFFDKDLIEWNEKNSYTELYEELTTLKHWHPALRAGEKGGDLYSIECSESWRIFAVKRRIEDHVIIALFNFSPHDANIQIYDPEFNGVFKQIGSPLEAILATDHNFYLQPWGSFIYYK